MRKRMLYLLTVIMILGTLIFTACPVSHAKVYKEGKKYTFTGKVKKIRWQHINGTWQTSYVLTLNKKIKVKTQVMGKTKEKKIQIWGETKKLRKKIKKCVGKKIKVKGRLDAHGSSYYYFPVDLQVLEIKKM